MTEYWFKPKQRGIGPGQPISWKGWVVFGAYVASILAVPEATVLVLGYEGSPYLRLAAVGVISVPFLFLMWLKTEGGWHWRNRRDEFEAEDETGA